MTGGSNNKQRTLLDRKKADLWSNRVLLMTVASRLGLSSDFEVGAAAAIHPDDVTGEAPGPPLHTGRLAPLIHQADDAASIDKVDAASPVV